MFKLILYSELCTITWTKFVTAYRAKVPKVGAAEQKVTWSRKIVPPQKKAKNVTKTVYEYDE